jgi:thiamine-monophosphate kinase
MEIMNEFDLIEKYFRPLAGPEALGLKDDAAILNVPKGFQLAVTSDTLGAGTHFLGNEKPEHIARKSLRVNLSDLAAMGAKPYAYQLCIAFPEKPKEAWIKKFSAALAADQKKFGIFCSGGDTTVTKGPLTISITAFGLVRENKAVKRSGAKPGDVLVITGPVGDALIGLRILQGKIKTKSVSCVAAYHNPVPRTGVSDIIRAHARAAIDISDGLIADVGHICETSNCAAHIDLQKIKFSKDAAGFIKKGTVKSADLLTGGDDYELALAVPPKNLPGLLKKLSEKGLKPQIIGKFAKGKPAVTVFNKGRKIRLGKGGWTHF